MATRKKTATKSRARTKTLASAETPLARTLTYIFTLLCIVFLALAYVNYMMPGM